jgi:hypothetical protein
MLPWLVCLYVRLHRDCYVSHERFLPAGAYVRLRDCLLVRSEQDSETRAAVLAKGKANAAAREAKAAQCPERIKEVEAMMRNMRPLWLGNAFGSPSARTRRHAAQQSELASSTDSSDSLATPSPTPPRSSGSRGRGLKRGRPGGPGSAMVPVSPMEPQPTAAPVVTESPVRARAGSRVRVGANAGGSAGRRALQCLYFTHTSPRPQSVHLRLTPAHSMGC